MHVGLCMRGQQPCIPPSLHADLLYMLRMRCWCRASIATQLGMAVCSDQEGDNSAASWCADLAVQLIYGGRTVDIETVRHSALCAVQGCSLCGVLASVLWFRQLCLRFFTSALGLRYASLI